MKLPFTCSWWIEPGKILGGRYPGTKNQAESLQMLDDLLVLGVRVIINLQQPDERGRGGSLFPDYRPLVTDLAAKRGIDAACHRYPIPDLGVPSGEAMAEIQATIQQAVDAGQMVYIHCWGGHGRTGTVAGCWLVSQGATPTATLQMIKDRRSHDIHLANESAPQTPEQRKVIEAWHARSKPGQLTKAGSSSTIGVDKADARRDQSIGSLIGLAVGDAVGTTIEFQSPGTFTPLVDMIGGGPFDLKPGEWTDDTSMALCLAESLTERSFFDPIDQLQRYVKWWKKGHFSVKGHCFDIGTQVRAALMDFVASGNPYCGPIGPMNAGNGSLMRLCPVVIAHAHSPSAAIFLAGQSSRTTHGNRECVDACRFFAGLLVSAIRGTSKDELLQTMHAPLPDLWHHEPLTPKVAAIAAGSFKTKSPPDIRGTGYVVDCLEAALWAFHSTDSYEDAVLAAANLGDDADTTAAVCGQLAGAFYGLTGIPEKWLVKLAQRKQIEALAASVFKLTGQ